MFTKWIEVFRKATPDPLTRAKAVVKDIIPNFGIPEKSYSEN